RTPTGRRPCDAPSTTRSIGCRAPNRRARRWRAVVRRSGDHCQATARVRAREPAGETVARGRAAIDDLLTATWRMPVAVSHGQLMGLVLHTLDARFRLTRWEEMSTPGVYLLVADGGPVRFERVWREAG